MNSFDTSYVVDTVNAGSQLVKVAVPAALAITGQGSSKSGTLTAQDVALVDASHNRVGFVLNGQGPFEITLAPVPAIVPSVKPTVGPTVVSAAISGAGTGLPLGTYLCAYNGSRRRGRRSSARRRRSISRHPISRSTGRT